MFFRQWYWYCLIRGTAHQSIKVRNKKEMGHLKTKWDKKIPQKKFFSENKVAWQEKNDHACG